MKSKLLVFAAVLALLLAVAIPVAAHSGIKLYFGTDQAAANFDKVGGVIDCYYDVKGGQLSMNCYCPAGTVCELNVDGSVIATATVNAFGADDGGDNDDDVSAPTCVPPACWPPSGYGPYWPKP